MSAPNDAWALTVELLRFKPAPTGDYPWQSYPYAVFLGQQEFFDLLRDPRTDRNRFLAVVRDGERPSQRFVKFPYTVSSGESLTYITSYTTTTS